MKAWKSSQAWIDRLRNSDRRDWKVFFLSLLLAFSIWIIHNLSLNYSEYVDVRLRAKSNIEGRATLSSNVVGVHALCRMSGYNHLRAKIRNSRKESLIFFDRSMLRTASDGKRYYLTSRDLQEYNSQLYGEGAKVEFLFNDTLFFNFPEENSKKVPVEFVGDLNCRSQFSIGSEIKVYPDSVTVYGEPYHLENIHSVSTQPLILTELDKSQKGFVKLRNINSVRMSESRVAYEIDVIRYVEMSGRFRVEMRNVPADKEVVLIPGEVEVSFWCPFPLSSNPLETSTLYVDFDDYVESYGGKCCVKLQEGQADVLRWFSYPEMLDCIVKEKN